MKAQSKADQLRAIERQRLRARLFSPTRPALMIEAIVGRWDSADGREHGFHWLNGVFKVLYVPDAVQTLPDAINNRSDVVGRAIMADGSVLGFYRRDEVFQTFSYPGAKRTVARGVNDNVDIVGPFEMPDGKRRGFVLRAMRVDEVR